MSAGTAPPRLIVVTGPPGAGKTTIASELRVRLGLPLIAKDALKETLGSELGITERADSHRLGAGVFQVLALLVHELLRQGVSTIAEGNFTTRSALFHDLPECSVVQVHVTAAAGVLSARLRERDSHRHPVHYDAEAAEEIVARACAGEWNALDLPGTCVSVDTTTWPDLATLCDRVRAAF